MYYYIYFYIRIVKEVIWVPFTPKNKVEAGYKTIYLPKSLIEKLEKMANDNSTSFNNVVVSMIEHCLEENDETS